MPDRSTHDEQDRLPPWVKTPNAVSPGRRGDGGGCGVETVGPGILPPSKIIDAIERAERGAGQALAETASRLTTRQVRAGAGRHILVFVVWVGVGIAGLSLLWERHNPNSSDLGGALARLSTALREPGVAGEPLQGRP